MPPLMKQGLEWSLCVEDKTQHGRGSGRDYGNNVSLFSVLKYILADVLAQRLETK